MSVSEGGGDGTEGSGSPDKSGVSGAASTTPGGKSMLGSKAPSDVFLENGQSFTTALLLIRHFHRIVLISAALSISSIFLPHVFSEAGRVDFSTIAGIGLSSRQSTELIHRVWLDGQIRIFSFFIRRGFPVCLDSPKPWVWIAHLVYEPCYRKHSQYATLGWCMPKGSSSRFAALYMFNVLGD
jgi:hypothetical protein